MSRSRRRLVVLALVAVVGAAGCGGGVESLSFPAPPVTSALPTTTVPLPADYSGVTDRPVPGVTTTTVPVIGPGTSTLDGTVIGPAGPVSGATVEAERIVGGAAGEATTEATTAADGSFTIPGVLGGIYRVRAWQSPTLTLTTPQVLFVDDGQAMSLTLTLQAFDTVQFSSAMAPDPVQVGDPANLVVSVTEQSVGDDGMVRPVPMGGQALTVDGGGGWDVTSADPATTNGGGQASFTLTCASASAAPLVATIAGSTATLTTSTCAEPPPPASTTTTSTTVPGPTPSTATPVPSSLDG